MSTPPPDASTALGPVSGDALQHLPPRDGDSGERFTRGLADLDDTLERIGAMLTALGEKWSRNLKA